MPVIPVSARKRTGLDILIHAAIHHKGSKGPDRLIHEHKEISHHAHDHHDEYTMVYSDAMEDRIDEVETALVAAYPDMKNVRWHAIKTLEGDREICEKYPVKAPCLEGGNYEAEIINEKYDFIGEIIDEVMVHNSGRTGLPTGWTERSPIRYGEYRYSWASWRWFFSSPSLWATL